MRVANIKQTCSACPSQWEGHTEDGRMFYIRFRWGGLSIEISEEPTNVIQKAMDILLFDEQISDSLDGILTEEELKPYMNKVGFIL